MRTTGRDQAWLSQLRHHWLVRLCFHLQSGEEIRYLVIFKKWSIFIYVSRKGLILSFRVFNSNCKPFDSLYEHNIIWEIVKSLVVEF